MSERYTRIFTLPAQAAPAQVHPPVEVAAGALLKDNENGIVLAQVKFKNISDKSIRSMVVNVSAQDAQGVSIKGVTDFAYENLIAASGDFFGDQVPIVMSDNNAYAFAVEVVSVKFSDGTGWSKLGEQAAKTAKIVGTQAVSAAKTATKAAAEKTSKSALPFIINLVVFVFFAFIALAYLLALPDQHTTQDLLCTVIFTLLSVITFPVFGSMLKKKENGSKLRVIRWLVVAGILLFASAYPFRLLV